MMIDYKEMVQKHETGLRKVESLQEAERDILKHYCSMLAEEIMKAGSGKSATFSEVAVNSVKNGIALGLELAIVNGEVLGRAA